MMICSAGSSLGERTMAAIETCSNNAVAAGRGNKPKCPKVEDLESDAMEEYAGEICVFQELGWMDSDMNEMEEVIQADIDTLPAEIAEALNGEPYEKCLAKAEKKIMSMAKKYKKIMSMA